jgi:large subunit ribosomal protein L10
MNRDEKAVAIADIAAKIDEAHAIFAVDYRGISVPDAAELRAKLRESDATFKVVKNSLTERAADQAGVQELKELLAGPTALTFVRGDAATAAKAIADYTRLTQLLPFKGGMMDGTALDAEQIRSISRLPSREVLYGQLVGVVASPVSGLVRTLGALVGGLAFALGQVREKKESGELPAGAPPADAQVEAPEAQAPEVEAPEAEAPPADAQADAPEADAQADAPEADAPKADAADVEAPAETPEVEPTAEAPEASASEPSDQAEPADQPAEEDDKHAEESADPQPDPTDENPTKED